MNIEQLRRLADDANSQHDGHRQPPLPNWNTIGNLIAAYDQLLAMARTAKKCSELYDSQGCTDSEMSDCVSRLSYAYKQLPASIKSAIEAPHKGE